MHAAFERYETDPRRGLLCQLPAFQKLFLYASDEIGATNWHWLKYHFQRLPPGLTAESIASALLDCEMQIDDLGKFYLDQIASIRDREKDESDYQAILQIFGEIFALRQVFSLLWTAAPSFTREPAGQTGKRPELLVSSGPHRFLFEVKTPSLLDHQRMRSNRGIQIPGRATSREMFETLSTEPMTLPRDNPIKDFLISAQMKFSDFDALPGANLLIIVWDDHIYEPITALMNQRSGLLTPDSYFRDKDGKTVVFPAVDGVIVLRHLNYFMSGLAERSLKDRLHLFDFGDDQALPNVFLPTPWGRPVPDFILAGLRAYDYRDKDLSTMAEYHCQEVVLWIAV